MILVSINYYKKDGAWSRKEEVIVPEGLSEVDVRKYLKERRITTDKYAVYKFSTGSRLREYLDVIPDE